MNNKRINFDKKNASASLDQDTQQRHERSRLGHQRRRPLATSPSLFVTGLAHSINKSHVERLFSKFGEIERISEFMTSKNSLSSSRFCFVEYTLIENAQKAIDNLNGRTLLHRRLVVLPAHTSTDDNSSSSRKTTVGNLNPKKERILIDKKIEALKKKIGETHCD